MTAKRGRPKKQGPCKIIRSYTIDPELYNEVSTRLEPDQTISGIIEDAMQRYLLFASKMDDKIIIKGV